jgi:excisionase family DNA binding protein
LSTPSLHQPVAELLTTHQVVELLRVDRTTVYRLVAGGHLPAIRVGKQWRFARAEVDALLGKKAAAGEPLAPPAEVRTTDAPLDLRSVPFASIQSLQDTVAELLGVMLIVTDMEGRIVTEPSNVCGYYRALAPTGGLDRLCDITWPKLAAALPLNPQFVQSSLGPLCTRGLIRVHNRLEGMLVAGCIAPDSWPPSDEVVSYAAGKAGVSLAKVTGHVEEVHRLSCADRQKVLNLIQRLADMVSQIIAEKL